MKKTLVLYARVSPFPSFHTKPIFDEFSKLENTTVRFLEENEVFDVKKEQEFVQSFDRIVLLFPLYWYNIPWTLSRYFAQVWRTFPFTLEGREVYKVVTAGGGEGFYSESGAYFGGVTIPSFLKNVDGMLKKLRATKKEHFIYYDSMSNDKDRLESFKNEVINFFKK